MSFAENVERARELLRRNGRVSLRLLRREFELDDAALDDVVEELVDVQQVAARDGKVLAWIGAASAESAAAESQTSTTVDASAESVGTAQSSDAERRQLTVLFCDLVDSTQMAARLDPEDWREVVRDYQGLCSEVVERFEGHVAQYLGDGVLIYFGWPQAHEDDAERAVRAGREILSGLGALNERIEPRYALRLAARVGIHTGPVVVGEMGGGLSRETLAMGDTTNFAARLQGVAEPDTVVLSAATLHLTQGIFVTEDLGAQKLKGIADEVHAYRVLDATGVRSRLDVGGKLTRFVGREQEIGLLVDRWEQVLEGDGQTVFVSGEAGLGKSRLALSLRERLSEEAYTWLECRSNPYAQKSALLPIVALVEQGLAFTDEDTPEGKAAKLQAALDTERFPTAETRALLADLLGLPLAGLTLPEISPELKRERTLDALLAWILALGELQPVILLIEDLHWCDPSSVELMGRLAEQIPTSRVLMVLTARPEFEVPWSNPKNWTPIVLGRLRKRQARDVVGSLSEGGPLTEEVVARIVDRADGSPLYLEELTRVATESEGLGLDVTVPATLQDSLMARLDRLSAAKEVAQLAAPLGREFPYRLLAASADIDESLLRQGLERLVESDLMLQRGTPPNATYAFRHALIQETAYESLPRSQRQRAHARVAKALEEHFPGRLDAEPELLAQHLAGAHQADRAAQMFQRAGLRASQDAAHEEAIDHFERALEQLREVPASEERERRQLGLEVQLGAATIAARGYAAPEVGPIWERARALASGLGDINELTTALVGLSSFLAYSGKTEPALAHAEELLRLAERTKNRMAKMAGHAMMANALQFSGEYERSLQHAERSLKAYRIDDHRELGRLFGTDLAILCHGLADSCLRPLGFPERALQHIDAGLELATQLQHLFSSDVTSRLFQCWMLIDNRSLDAAASATDRLIEAAEELRVPFFLGFGQANRGFVRILRDREEAGLGEIQAGLGILASTGQEGGTPYVLCFLAEANHVLGKNDDARGAADVALAIAEETGDHWWDPELLRVKGEIAQATGARDEAVAAYEESLRIARTFNARGFELRTADRLARLLAAEGEREQARDLLQPIYDWFTEGFDTPDLKDAKALLEDLA